ncbi:hypothetical protein JCM10212_004471 [Sporobolomyces blumeae]
MPPASAWSPPRAKIQLKLSIQRTRVLALKKSQSLKQTRREIANLLDVGKVESARIKVEGVVAEELNVELLELLELFCEVLVARFGLLEMIKEIDPGVNEAVASIIHAAPRTELKELHVLREMLMSKAGRDYAIAAIDNVDGIVPERITSKLVIATPPKQLVDSYLYEIAKAYGVDWQPEGIEPPAASIAPDATPASPSIVPKLAPFDSTSLGSTPHVPPTDPSKPLNEQVVVVRSNVEVDHAQGPTSSSASSSMTPARTGTAGAGTGTDLGAKSTTNVSNGGSTSQAKKDQDAFDALAKRFAELKKR